MSISDQNIPIQDESPNSEEDGPLNFPIHWSVSMGSAEPDHMMGKHLVQAIKENEEMLHLCTRGLKSCENCVGCGVTTFREHVCLYNIQRARYKNIEKIVVTVTGVKEFEIDEELREFFGKGGKSAKTTNPSYKKEISFFVK